MIYNSVVNYKEWITQKYVEWRGNAVGRERSITDFAEYIGVSQQLMNDWLNKGKKPRSQETIGKLAAIYGDEVYGVLGGRPKDDVLGQLMKLYYQIPEEDRAYFVDEITVLALKLAGAKRIQ